MKINVLESSSATSVKNTIKGSIQMKAKKKIEVEDATHESVLKRGEIFYLSNSPKGIFLFDLDEDTGKYWKFKITRNKFNQLKRDHKILSEDAAKGTKKPTRKPSPKKVAQDNSEDLAKLAAIALFGANTRTSMTKKNVQILSNLAATEEFLKSLKPGQRYPFNLNDLIKDLVSLLESKKLGFVSSIKSKYGIDFASPAFSTDGWKQGTAFKSRGGTFGDGRMIRVTPKQAASMLKSGKQTPLAITSIFEPKQPTRFSLDLIRNAQTSGDVELGDYDVPARKETITKDPNERAFKKECLKDLEKVYKVMQKHGIDPSKIPANSYMGRHLKLIKEVINSSNAKSNLKKLEAARQNSSSWFFKRGQDFLTKIRGFDKENRSLVEAEIKKPLSELWIKLHSKYSESASK